MSKIGNKVYQLLINKKVETICTRKQLSQVSWNAESVVPSSKSTQFNAGILIDAGGEVCQKDDNKRQEFRFK